MTVKRDRPWDFDQQAAVLTNKALMALYEAGQHTVARWRAEIGTPVVHKTELLPLPADWFQVAPGKSKNDLKRIYKRHMKTINRWCAETGVETNGRPNPNGERDRPDDFAERWAGMSQIELMAHYQCGSLAIRRWIKELGLKRPVSVVAPKERPPAKLKAMLGPVDRVQRDMSHAGQAVDFLRRYGAVWRCNAQGAPSIDGKFWRRGASVLTDTEVIERAKRLGFDPSAWSRLPSDPPTYPASAKAA